ncbi:MAG: sensor histidine kinase [Caldimonas sp.]
MDIALLRRSWRSWLSQDDPDPGPWWLAFVWTLAFCVLVAVGLTLVGYALSSGRRGGAGSMANWWRWYQTNLMISLCVGYAIHFLFLASTRIVGKARLQRARPWQRTVFYSTVPIVGVSIGWPLGVLWVLGVDLRGWVEQVPGNALAGGALLSLILTIVFHQFFALKNREIQAENRATEAQLRLLQAQIEPHFLFNTLANVVSLMEADTARARLMLESFVDYLRASLAGLSQNAHTLGDELALVEAYMRIIEIRMEDRLHYTIDVAEGLRGLALPALSLQPLVENAIVHGLEPLISGGTIRISARREGPDLVVTVEDDGAGMSAEQAGARPVARTRGSGTALANIRERLRQAHGGAAALRIESVLPHGVRASLSLPSLARDGATPPAPCPAR